MNRDDVKKLADLARLSLSDEQCDAYQKDFEGILGYIDTISSVEVKDVPASHVFTNVVRDDDDSYEPGAFTDDLLREAPSAEEGYIKVKKIL